MKKKAGGAPKKPPDKAKGKLIQFRVGSSEKEAFEAAADADGKGLSGWIRDRLRRDSRQELESLGRKVPFLSGGPE